VLSIDVSEHTSILNNDTKIRTTAVLVSHPKQARPHKTGVQFLLSIRRTLCKRQPCTQIQGYSSYITQKKTLTAISKMSNDNELVNKSTCKTVS